MDKNVEWDKISNEQSVELGKMLNGQNIAWTKFRMQKISNEKMYSGKYVEWTKCPMVKISIW